MTNDEVVAEVRRFNASYKNTSYNYTGTNNIAGTTVHSVEFRGENEQFYTSFLIQYPDGAITVCGNLYDLFNVLRNRPLRWIDNPDTVKLVGLLILAGLLVTSLIILTIFRAIGGDTTSITALFGLTTGVFGYLAAKKG